jgi:hypothetical protein
MTTRSSHLSSLRRSGVRIMLLATPLLLAMSANADTISIGFQEAGVNSGNITTVGTGSGTLTLPSTPYGSFIVNQANAQDFAVLPAPGLLNSNALDISSSTAGTLTIWVTAQGLSFTGVQNFRSAFAVNEISGSVTGVDESTYFSPTNGLFDAGQTLLNSASFSAIGTAGPFFTTGTTSGTYSVTEKYVITDIGGTSGDDNITIDLGATPVVPEPGTLLLAGSGLALAGLLYYRRHHKRPRLLINNA